MHVQVKSTLKSAAFSDEVEDEEGSVEREDEEDDEVPLFKSRCSA